MSQDRPILNASFQLFFDDLCQRQQDRIARKLSVREQQKRLDPGGGYLLTIRGHKPAQIALEAAPDQVLMKEGEVGRRIANWSFLAGS